MAEISSIYSKAPDIILDKLAEVNGVLSKQKPDAPNTIFWKGVADTLKYAFNWINEHNWIIRENELLQAENKFLKQWAGELSNRLNAYESIKAEKLAGTFNETVKKVDEFLKNNE